MKYLTCSLTCPTIPLGFAVLFFGCATTNPNITRLQTDTRFQEAARQLVTDYLEAQKQGDSGIRFGGGGRFYNLAEYQIVNFGWEWNSPAVFLRIKAGNQGGGNPIWRDYAIRLSHDPKLEAAGDRYLGLRVGSAGETRVKF